MADSVFTVKVDNRTFTLDRITLGDWRMLKTEFGLTASDIVMSLPDGKGGVIETLNLGDPSVLVGLMVAALKHERPYAPLGEIIAEVEDLGMEGLEFPSNDPEDEADAEDPTPVGDDDGEEAASPAKSGKSAKPRKQPGTQR